MLNRKWRGVRMVAATKSDEEMEGIVISNENWGVGVGFIIEKLNMSLVHG